MTIVKLKIGNRIAQKESEITEIKKIIRKDIIKKNQLYKELRELWELDT